MSVTYLAIVRQECRTSCLLRFAYSAAGLELREKKAATRAMRKSKCRGIPFKFAFLTGHEALPAQKPGRRESPPGDSADKMTWEACPGKSSNGKEKRPRSRREKVSVPGFFHTSPEIKIPSPEKEIPGLGISLSGPEISRQTVQKVNCSDKILHKSPVLCKKNRAKIRYLGRIAQKSRHENQPKRNNLSVFTSIL